MEGIGSSTLSLPPYPCAAALGQCVLPWPPSPHPVRLESGEGASKHAIYLLLLIE